MIYSKKKDLRAEFLLKTDCGYTKDREVATIYVFK